MMSTHDARAPGYPITLLVPGPWSGPAAMPVLPGWSVEWIPNDGGIADAFGLGAFPGDQLPPIAQCPGALVVEGRADPLADHVPLATLGSALLRAGALAIRMEQSQAAWPAADWVELIAAAELFGALVVLLQGQEGVSSRGMHLFGLPDAAAVGTDAASLVSALCRYQLDEDPLLLPGHTFCPTADSRRRTLERWPDARVSADHPCWNPFGVWRLLEHSSSRAARLAHHFMPSLVAQLRAAEGRAGRRLNREEVETLRDQAPCVAVEPRDARALERTRGYADLDPELAWEQWSLLRTCLG